MRYANKSSFFVAIGLASAAAGRSTGCCKLPLRVTRIIPQASYRSPHRPTVTAAVWCMKGETSQHHRLVRIHIAPTTYP